MPICCAVRLANPKSITISELRDVDCKTFLIHGTSDSVVRVSNSRTNQTRLQHSYAPYYARQRLLFLDLPALSVSLSRKSITDCR